MIQPITGDRFGQLAVIKTYKVGYHFWCSCKCNCGVVREIRASSLVHGFTKSCGCIRRKRAATLDYKHGMSNSVEWVTWRSMIQRCLSPKHKSYKDYGARGITVCKRWRNFPNFLADMGRKPNGLTLDRKNNDGNYEPSNCRWASLSEQAKNRRPRERTSSGRYSSNSKEPEPAASPAPVTA